MYKEFDKERVDHTDGSGLRDGEADGEVDTKWLEGQQSVDATKHNNGQHEAKSPTQSGVKKILGPLAPLDWFSGLLFVIVGPWPIQVQCVADKDERDERSRYQACFE